MSLYDILEIKPNASEMEIKKAYYRLAKIHHPDRCSDVNATEKFQKIQSAYEVLINDKTRIEYLKLNSEDKHKFSSLIETILGNKINMEMLKSLGIKLTSVDWKYLQENYSKLFKIMNIKEILSIFSTGKVVRKEDDEIDCSESDTDIFTFDFAKYYESLPLYLQRHNKLDIKMNFNIKLGDIINNIKKKIKIKRNIEDETVISTFEFKMTKPWVVFTNAGDMDLDGNYGSLIINLILPQNYEWTDKLIIIEQPISLYELVYGLNINIDIGTDNSLIINEWVPSRDGFLIDISNIKIPNYSLAIKLYMNYEHSQEKEELLKKYFS
jgi:curved DNA-binding protein CbpA